MKSKRESLANDSVRAPLNNNYGYISSASPAGALENLGGSPAKKANAGGGVLGGRNLNVESALAH